MTLRGWCLSKASGERLGVQIEHLTFDLHSVRDAVMEVVPRALTATIQRAYRSFPAVLVTGPRRSGHTTPVRRRPASGRWY